MFKDLLVATTGIGDDAAAFASACALARSDDAHVAVLVQVEVPTQDAGTVGMFPVEAFVAMHEQAVRQGEAERARWRNVLERAGVRGEVRLAANLLSSPPRTAAFQAHYADLVLMGLASHGTLPGPVHDQVSKVLHDSGRPLLVVPEGCSPSAYARVAIAWHPGSSAARAVHDAMPFLERASAIDVICANPEPGEGNHGPEPGSDIALHLARHGLDVRVHCEDDRGDEPGRIVLRCAREFGATLLVMGGYSHSRMREWVLGGTTRHVLMHSHLPVLMSH